MTWCYDGLGSDLLNECTDPVATGTKEEIYVINRSDITDITYDATDTYKVTGITLANPAYKIKGFKNSTNPSYSFVARENAKDVYSHSVPIMVSKNDAATIKQLDELGDVVIITERNASSETGDGDFEIYGLQYGLFPSEGTKSANDSNGMHSLTLASREGIEEPKRPEIFDAGGNSATKTALEALLSVA
jgi:hypothetical protein